MRRDGHCRVGAVGAERLDKVGERASAAPRALTAAVIDELVLDVVPVLLGAGERLFDGVDDPGLEPVEAIHSPNATHIRYRVGAAGGR